MHFARSTRLCLPENAIGAEGQAVTLGETPPVPYRSEAEYDPNDPVMDTYGETYPPPLLSRPKITGKLEVKAGVINAETTFDRNGRFGAP